MFLALLVDRPYASVNCPLVEPHRDALDRAKARAFPQQSRNRDLLVKGLLSEQRNHSAPWVGAKYAQEYPYMSEKWRAHYGLDRAHVKNLNMRLKVGYAALHEPRRCPARRFFAQLLYTAFLITSTICNAIYKWMFEKTTQRSKVTKFKSRKGRCLLVDSCSNAKVQPDIADPPQAS